MESKRRKAGRTRRPDPGGHGVRRSPASGMGSGGRRLRAWGQKVADFGHGVRRSLDSLGVECTKLTFSGSRIQAFCVKILSFEQLRAQGGHRS